MAINPEHLFEQAERLATPPLAGPPRQADIRRAISAAYYGVFHAVLTAAADQFVGVTKRTSSQYALVYRAIDHRGLRDLCEDLRKSTPPQKYVRHTPADGFGPDIVAFATAVVEIYDKRQFADYDPTVRMKMSDAQLAIKTARAATRRFERATSTRKTAFLTLLLFPPRR